MTDETLESRLKAAVEKLTPEDFDSVRKACEEQKGTVVFVPKENTKRNPLPKIVAAVLIVAVLAGGGFGLGYRAANAVDAVVALDVNPSIELNVNKKDKVVSVNPLNDDAVTILGEMDLKGSDVDVAVNALLGAMVRAGYIDDLANSILISVEGDEARSAELEARLMQSVNALLSGEGQSAAILSQTVTQDAALQDMASTYGISLGRAQLINAILEKDPTKTIEDQAALTVNELNLLAQAKQATTQDLTVTGTASQAAYIGESKAEDAALSAAGVSRSGLTYIHTKLDWEDGVLVYEVEFLAGTTEYEYDINAATGAVVKFEKETQGGSGSAGNGAASGASITLEQAKQVALKDAGLSESQVTFRKQKLDNDDGWLFYELEFATSTTEYEYDINAATGAISGQDVETVRQSGTSGSTSGNSGSTSTGTAITLDKAKSIALGDAGLSTATFLKNELDYDDGRQYYELEFVSGSTKYEYEVNASTGAVVKRETETYRSGGSTSGSSTSTGSSTSGSTSASGDIGHTAARDKALAHAGLTFSQVWELEVEKDRDDGVTVYEVSFKSGNLEYDYEINAATGAILKAESEYD